MKRNNNGRSGESNAGAGMNDNSHETLRKGVRKNASHPGDAGNAAGMRHEDRKDEGASPKQGGKPAQDKSHLQRGKK